MQTDATGAIPVTKKEPSFRDYRCRKCGENGYQLILLALMCTAGAEVLPSPTVCIDGGKHEFVKGA